MARISYTTEKQINRLRESGMTDDEIMALAAPFMIRISKDGEILDVDMRGVRAIEKACTDLAAKARMREAAIEAGKQIRWTKIGIGWGITGPGLVQGAQVTVTRRDGSTSTETVGMIISDVDGIQTARIATTSSQSRGYRIQDGGEIWDYA